MSEIKAYLAGLIDGEAYVGIKKHFSKKAKSPLYHERIQVRMVDESSIKLLKETLGGSYYRENPRSVKGRPLYCYQASDRLAAEILGKLLPYLRVKKSVALVVIELRRNKEKHRTLRQKGGVRLGSPAGYTMNEEILAEREALYLRCKHLNQVGI